MVCRGMVTEHSWHNVKVTAQKVFCLVAIAVDREEETGSERKKSHRVICPDGWHHLTVSLGQDFPMMVCKQKL